MALKLLLPCLLFCLTSHANIRSPKVNLHDKSIQRSVYNKNITTITKYLLGQFKRQLSAKDKKKIKEKVLGYSGRSVPALMTVMKDSKYPDPNRWMATFLVGRIMGKKSGPFVAKFLEHPNWIMRMASLKTLLAIRDKRFAKQYIDALSDKSILVRRQALDNIRVLKISNAAPKVWGMLYDDNNYHKINNKLKRSTIIKEVIKTVGELKFSVAKPHLLSMIKSKKYSDIFPELEYSLELISNIKAPKGSISQKRAYWKKIK